jgi:holliday junction DNA helicase RuvB
MAKNENALRPIKLSKFFGQKDIVKRLRAYLYSAKKRNCAIDHMLFYGPPGLGKTTLANIVANELKSHIVAISAPTLAKPGDLASILSTLNAGDVLFIDEIHRLDKAIEETLYSVLEDFKLNITYKTEENVKALSINISPFTLIGATTMAGLLSVPLRERFGIVFKFSYYSVEEITEIVLNNSKILGINVSNDECFEIAKRSRQTPRVANNILKRVFDYAIFKKIEDLNVKKLNEAFNFLHIDCDGLNDDDVEIIKVMYTNYKTTPVSLESIANLINENPLNIREINEPFLVSSGYIERTKRGRILTKKGVEKYKLLFPQEK